MRRRRKTRKRRKVGKGERGRIQLGEGAQAV